MKLLLTSIFLSLLLFASDSSDKLRVKILETIFSEITIDEKLRVWSDNKNILSEIREHDKFETATSCNSANIIILEYKENLQESCSSKCIFVLKYNLLSDIEHSFGALFWKKGRPNIVILEPRVKSQSIIITKDLEPYLEDKVW